MVKVERFPKCKVGQIFNEYQGRKINGIQKKYNEIEILYPCRLDAMAINPSAVCYNEKMVFTPGEVVISVEKFIKVKIKATSKEDKLIISPKTNRKVLVKHAYLLMKKVLKFKDQLIIDVDSSEIPKHCGFGSSSSTIAAVSAAINELYGHPIDNGDLIKYLASNHGEEVSDDNEEELKVVQCIGGGATSGLTDAGIIILAGKSTTICKMNYDATVLIATPKDFQLRDADYLMKKEEENLWKFKKTGDTFSKDIAFRFLHEILPDMVNNSIQSLADLVFDYRFNMGSIENCSFVYENMIDQANVIRKLYENNKCDFLALSSVGPAFFILLKDRSNIKNCIEVLNDLNMNIVETKVCNSAYKIERINGAFDFWNQKGTEQQFKNKKTSKYITDQIDAIANGETKFLDVGCGGGRYSRYLKEKNIPVLAIDKYANMAQSLKKDNIDFINAAFDKLPVDSSSFDCVLSIGVIHNAVTIEEYNAAFKEMFRVLKKNGKVIISIFTNDIISEDLIQVSDDCYNVKNRPPMVLLSKDKIEKVIINNGFKIIKIIDEHITYVGNGGKRNVYSLLLEK